ELFLLLQVPNTDTSVFAARHQAILGRMERDGMNNVGVTLQIDDLFAGFPIPENYVRLLIIGGSAGSDALPIRVHGQGIDRCGMVKRFRYFAGLGIPDLYGLVHAPRD